MTFQGRENAAYAAVHDSDLSGVGGHAFGNIILPLCGNFSIAFWIEFAGHAQFGCRRDDSQQLLFFQSFGSDGMGGFAVVEREHFFYFPPGGLEGCMRSRISHVKEEGLPAFGGIVNIGQSRFGDIVRHVKILRQILRTEQFPVFTEGSVRHGPVVICRSTQQTAGTVEAAVPWIGSPNFSKMPFPGKVGTVSRFFQKFRQGGDIRVQASAVAGAPAVVIQEPYVHLVRFAAGHDGGPGG